MKVVLPVEKDPPVKMLPGLAQPLSIICANVSDPEGFVINNYIQLYVDEYAGVDTPLFNSFSKKTVNTFFLPDNLISKMFDVETISLLNGDALSVIKSEILKGSYIFSTLNEYFVPNTCFYQKVNMFHPELIYGFDDESEELFAFVYDENPKYTPISIKYSDFYVAYENTAFPMNFFTAYMLKKQFKFEFDLSLCKKLLYDYISSKNSFQAKSYDNTIYGIKVYDYLFKVIEELPNTTIDPRDFATLYEHKNIIYKLINRLDLKSLAKEYEKVLMLSIGVRTRAYQCYKFGDNAKICNEMLQILIKMRTLEEEILPKVYTAIINEKNDIDKMVKEDNTHISKRPYTKQSKVIDLINDTEIWTILEDYLPASSIASQLPIIYGMKIENLLAMAQIFFGITKEQSKEIYEKILTL